MFGLNWFKKKKQEEEKQPEVIKEEWISDKNVEVFPLEDILAKSDLISTAILSNNALTVRLKNGEFISCSNADKNMYERVYNAYTNEEIKQIMIPGFDDLMKKKAEEAERERQEEQKLKEKQEEAKIIVEGYEKLKAHKDFKVKDNMVYMKGIHRTLPPLLVNAFIKNLTRYDELNVKDGISELYEVAFLSLKRFWFWCCLNSRAEVADTLYEFLENNHLRLNKQGFFYSLRNVQKVATDTTKIDFISNTYTHIKAVWKKLPKNYEVWVNNDDEKEYIFQLIGKPFSKEKAEKTWVSVGNLDELYKNIDKLDENRYTDDRTGTFDIRIGKPVTMPPEKCSWSTQDCGEAGLHFTMDINSYGCGDTTILILINPMKVVGIGSHKGRCYEYLPLMTVPRDEANSILKDKEFDTLQLDEWYAAEDLEELENKAKEGFAREAKKHEFNIPSISTEEIKSIVKELKDIKKEIQNRVVNV